MNKPQNVPESSVNPSTEIETPKPSPGPLKNEPTPERAREEKRRQEERAGHGR